MAIAKSQKCVFFFFVVLARPMEWESLHSQLRSQIQAPRADSSFTRMYVASLTVPCHTMCPTHSNTKANPIVHFISILARRRREGGTSYSRDGEKTSLSRRSAQLSVCARELMWLHRRRRRLSSIFFPPV